MSAWGSKFEFAAPQYLVRLSVVRGPKLPFAGNPVAALPHPESCHCVEARSIRLSNYRNAEIPLKNSA
jgi:hypothetical protein